MFSENLDVLISIHAPREGSDLLKLQRQVRKLEFQSTLPVKGATLPDSFNNELLQFQSTLPVKGATALFHPAIAYLL